MTEQTVQEAVLAQVALDIHTTALDKGFWEPPHPFLAELNTKLVLIVSEVAEAMEVIRRQYDGEINPYTVMTAEQGADFLEEVADVIIRAYDLAQYFDTVIGSIGEIVTAKMAKNAGRPQKHNKRF